MYIPVRVLISHTIFFYQFLQFDFDLNYTMEHKNIQIFTFYFLYSFSIYSVTQ